jgi:hypothetical protein
MDFLWENVRTQRQEAISKSHDSVTGEQFLNYYSSNTWKTNVHPIYLRHHNTFSGRQPKHIHVEAIIHTEQKHAWFYTNAINTHHTSIPQTFIHFTAVLSANFREKSIFGEPNSRLDSQAIPYLLCNSVVYYCAHNSTRMDPIVSQSNPIHKIVFKSCVVKGVRGGAVGWGTALQTGRSRVRLTSLPAVQWPWDRPSLQQKWVPGVSSVR